MINVWSGVHKERDKHSQSVTHPSTYRAQCWLTSVIGRELVWTLEKQVCYWMSLSKCRIVRWDGIISTGYMTINSVQFRPIRIVHYICKYTIWLFSMTIINFVYENVSINKNMSNDLNNPIHFAPQILH